MKDVTTSVSLVERTRKPAGRKPLSRGLSDLAGWLFTVNAEGWSRRAQFYERHRDYFPRLASSPFVERCRELEAASREVAGLLFAMPPRVDLVPVRVSVSRIK